VVTYIVNQNEAPSSIKALAVAFGGYVIALVTAAYGITKGSWGTAPPLARRQALSGGPPTGAGRWHS
jgi:hypothetical protein